MREPYPCGVKAAGRTGMVCSLRAGHKEKDGTPHLAYVGHDPDDRCVWEGPWEDDKGQDAILFQSPNGTAFYYRPRARLSRGARIEFLTGIGPSDEVVVDIEDESNFT